MTLLALDVGNTDTTIGLFDGATLAASFVVASDERRTADEWFLVLDGFLDRTDLPDISAVSIG